MFINVTIRDVPTPHFKPISILLPIPAFRADTDTDNTTDTFYLWSTSNKSFCKQYQRMYLVNLAFYYILNFSRVLIYHYPLQYYCKSVKES